MDMHGKNHFTSGAHATEKALEARPDSLRHDNVPGRIVVWVLKSAESRVTESSCGFVGLIEESLI